MTYYWAISKILRTNKDYTKDDWESYFAFLNFWDCLYRYCIKGELVAIAAYYFIDEVENIKVLPKYPREGKYLCIGRIVVKDGFEKQNIPMKMLLRFLKENPEIEKVYWYKQTENNRLCEFNLKEKQYV